MIRLAIDVMSGDHGPKIVIPACFEIAKTSPHCHFLLVGDSTVIQSYLNACPEKCRSQFSVIATTQVIEMDDEPVQAMRHKKDSSMYKAIQLVKDKEADACISAGNTGALMVISWRILKTISGVKRPAIMAALPTPINKPTYVLDLGANVEANAEELEQFAIMASVAIGLEQKNKPAVGLLNVGVEDSKGTDTVKHADILLRKSKIFDYKGFVEGTDIFSGKLDIVVCDGFVGNVSLKAMEGLAHWIKDVLKASFKKNLFTKLIGLIAYPVLKAFSQQANPERYNGASLLGLQGIVVKSHGSAKQKAFQYAIEAAIEQVKKNIPERIKTEVSVLLNETQG